jgi:hypothetical protein
MDDTKDYGKGGSNKKNYSKGKKRSIKQSIARGSGMSQCYIF